MAEESKPRGPRRHSNRGGGGGRENGGGRRRGPDDEAVEKPQHVTVPIPPSLIGKTATGKICDIVRRGRGQFGFIYIGEGEATRADTPRIYFNFKDYTETRFPPRRNYVVSFTCLEDDEKRVYASNVQLTPQGAKDAEVREEEYLKRTAGEKREPRERRERRDKRDDDERTVTLMVTCEGKSGEKQITAKLSQSIGKLKHTATTEFDAPIEYNVYCADGTLLSRAILAEMSEGSIIHLKPAPATA